MTCFTDTQGPFCLFVGVICSGTSLGYYSIKPGDTLTNIAASCNTNVQTILAANGQVTDASLIYAGNQLCVPSSCSLAAKTPSPSKSPCCIFFVSRYLTDILPNVVTTCLWHITLVLGMVGIRVPRVCSHARLHSIAFGI